MTVSSESEVCPQATPGTTPTLNRKELAMTLKPTVLLKHESGVTAQWYDEPNNRMMMAIYSPVGERGKYALSQIAGPWSGVVKVDENDPKTWAPYIIPGFERERTYVLDQAELLLLCINADYGGMAALKSIFLGPIIGFDQ